MSKKLLQATLLQVVLVSAMTGLPIVSAHAGMIIENSIQSPPIMVVNRPAESGQVSFVPTIENMGKMPASINRVTRSMHAQTIGKALATLVPSGWSGYISDPKIKNIGSVDFKGESRPWPVVLEEVLNAHGLTAKIDWEKHEMSVSTRSATTR